MTKIQSRPATPEFTENYARSMLGESPVDTRCQLTKTFKTFGASKAKYRCTKTEEHVHVVNDCYEDQCKFDVDLNLVKLPLEEVFED